MNDGLIAVYIASPYTKGDQAINVRESLLIADKLACNGFAVCAPLLSHLWHFLCPHPIEFWMEQDFEWVRRCDVLLRLPGESHGADQEVALAKSLGKPVFYSVDILIRTVRDQFVKF